MKRRNLLKISLLGLLGTAGGNACSAKTVEEKKNSEKPNQKSTKPIVISTWKTGIPANKDAWEILKNNGNSLDAVETGVKNNESDPDNSSVGLGGLPDREGNVTLDSCIMDWNGNCGSVAYLKNIENPISVARMVMEKTPHVMLVGEGANAFARSQGVEEKSLLTEKSKKAYAEWLKESKYKPIINIENHDTIGMLAIDSDGNMSGACTTSGLAYKMAGRVGDSPIIGAGLYIDNEVGGAVATGLGEEIVKAAGSAIIVELMRSGMSPENACKALVERLIGKVADPENTQVCFLAMNKNGEHGSFSIYEGFQYAVHDGENNLIDGKYKKSY